MLRFDRQYGALGGEAPIGFVALDAFARRFEISGADFVVFRMLMTAMDGEWLSLVAEEAERKK